VNLSKQIYGMLHLAGSDPVGRALEEIRIFESEGVSGVIVENYHGTIEDVVDVIDSLYNTKLEIGINILPNEVEKAYSIARDFKIDFIQFDYVAGKYQSSYGVIKFDENLYKQFRTEMPNVKVFGGVHPKYYTPIKGSDLKIDINHGITLCDAIVVTGKKTGSETPLDKVKDFRESCGNFPLIVGAGVDIHNVVEQLSIADGAIVGSCFKPYKDTTKPVDAYLVNSFMEKVRSI